jgi:hypothetical protein
MPEQITTAEQIERIRALNDAARRNPGVACIANMTNGFATLPDRERLAVLLHIMRYDQFTGENDPYGERDFGAVYRLASGEWTQRRPTDAKTIAQTVFWKIDYYDNSLQQGSEEPWNALKTARVLTVMLGSEY